MSGFAAILKTAKESDKNIGSNHILQKKIFSYSFDSEILKNFCFLFNLAFLFVLL